MNHPTINQARATRQAAAQVYFHTQDKWKDNPEDTKLADKHLKAWRDWQDAQKEWDTAQRRANWIRAKRILQLAACGRGQEWASQFVRDDFKVIR